MSRAPGQPHGHTGDYMARTLSSASGSTATVRFYRNPAEVFTGPAEDTDED